MEEYGYLLTIAIILLSTKVLGLFTKRIKLPQVVGALLAGLILGPAVLGVVTETEFLKYISEIGVIVLMFAAGLETDINELKKTGLKSFLIALIGVIVPLAGGFAVASVFNKEADNIMPTSIFLQNIFIGVILTATSVSITVETLKEMGKLSTRAGNAILGAAIIDDVLGIIALTIVISMAGGDGEGVGGFSGLITKAMGNPNASGIGWVLLNILAFFAFSVVAAVVFHKGFKAWADNAQKDLRRHVIVSFAFCLAMSFAAEVFFGVADITGAFVAGLALSGTKRIHYVNNRFETLSYMLLSPVFFASIGLKVTLSSMSSELILFAILLLIVAIITKVVGCGLGAKICRYTNKESLQIGIGMISRGEVALIVASKGEAVGLMNPDFFGPIVIMVVITTIVTPILLKLVFKGKDDATSDVNIGQGYQEQEEFENAVQSIGRK